MKNSLRRIFALLMAVMMIAALGMSAAAEGEEGEETPTVVTTKEYEVTNFKTLTKEDKAFAPDTEFKFTIAPLDGAPAGVAFVAAADNQSVADGVLTIDVNPDTTDIDTDTEEAENSISYNAKFVINLMNGEEKIFTDPGVYSYTITELENTDNGITNDTATTRKLDVYIGTLDDGTLTIEGAMIFKGEDKLLGFVNDYDTAELKVTKTVTGNLGDRDKQFAFTITINGDEGENYYIEKYASAEATDPSATFTAENGIALTGITLADGEYFVVYGLSEGDSYTVIEDSDDAEGYTTTVVAETKDNEARTGSGTIDVAAEVVDESVAFTNDKSANVPTGIAMTVLPFVAMIALAAIVAILFFQKRERREA